MSTSLTGVHVEQVGEQVLISVGSVRSAAVALVFTRREWVEFLAEVRAGHHDLDAADLDSIDLDDSTSEVHQRAVRERRYEPYRGRTANFRPTGACSPWA